MKIGLGVAIGIDVALIVLVLLLGFFDLRGSNGMRVTTWAKDTATVIDVVSLLALAVIILAALPAANAFFRKQTMAEAYQGWVPGYPQPPDYPQQGPTMPPLY